VLQTCCKSCMPSTSLIRLRWVLACRMACGRSAHRTRRRPSERKCRGRAGAQVRWSCQGSGGRAMVSMCGGRARAQVRWSCQSASAVVVPERKCGGRASVRWSCNGLNVRWSCQSASAVAVPGLGWSCNGLNVRWSCQSASAVVVQWASGRSCQGSVVVHWSSVRWWCNGLNVRRVRTYLEGGAYLAVESVTRWSDLVDERVEEPAQ
jgi:hypothetical protein